MKIRIKGNSLRYRLTRSDIARFAATGAVQESINFGPAVLEYALCSTTAAQPSAAFSNNRITLYLPASWIPAWVNTDQVGFDHTVQLANGESLYLLVEKDFSCLDNVKEDQTDHYPNPLLNKKV